MATVGNNNLTLADHAKRMDPNGKIDRIVEIMSEKNEILDDMTFVEGNLPTGHKTTIRSGLPSVTWRLLNYGVQPSKSRTVQITDACGMLEAYSEVDKALAQLNGNTAEFRISEARAFIEAMGQEMATTVFYGNSSTDPEKFMGLAPRYNDPSAANGDQLINAGGSGSDNTSIYLVVWGDATAHGIFPKGSKAGLQHEDLGEVTLEDANGGKYQGYRDHFKWDAGLTVRDWRYIVRICNIDVSELSVNPTAGQDLMTYMTQALERVESLTAGRPVFYANRTIREYLRLQALHKTNVQLSLDEVAGKRFPRFGEALVKRVDGLVNTESAISFS